MEKKRVLLVEDEAVIAINIRKILEGRGYEVVRVVTTGEEAVKQALSGSPDLILMDIMLKGEMDGIAAAEKIKQSSDIPVIYMTAHSDDSTLQRAKATAPYGYVLKPASPNELYSAVEVALFKHDMEKRLRESEELHRLVLSNISDAVFVTDEKGAFTFICPNVEHIFGYTEDEVKSFGNISRLLGVTLYDDEILDEAGELSNIELEVKDRFGSPHSLLVNVKKVSVYGGSVLYTCRDVTDRRKMEDDLRFQSMLLDSIQDHITATDLDGTIVYVNEAEAKTFNRKREELIGASVREYGDDPQSGVTQDEIINTTRERGAWQGRVVNYDGGGNPVHFQAKTWLYLGPDGEPAGMVGISSDVTELARMEDELKITNRNLEEANDELLRANEELQAAVEEQEEINEELQAAMEELETANSELTATRNELIEKENTFELMVKNANDVIAIVKEDSTIEYINDIITEVIGYAPEELTGRRALGFIHPDDLEMTARNFTKRVRNEADPDIYLSSLVHRDGSRVEVEVKGKVMRVDGEVRDLVIIRDVSQRIKYLKKLRRREERLSLAIESARLGMWEWRADRGEAWFSERGLEMTGYTRDELRKNAHSIDFWAGLIHPDHRDRVVSELAAFAGGKADEYVDEFLIRVKSGEHRWLHGRCRIIERDDAGKPARSLGVFQDVTETKGAEFEINRMTERLRSVIENMPVMLVVFNDAEQIIVWNRECERVTGYTSEEVIKNETIFRRFYPDPEHYAEMVHELRTIGHDYNHRLWDITCKDGSVKNILWSNISGRFPVEGWHSWAVGIDITERTRALKKLIESERKFHTIAASITDAMYVIDFDGFIVDVNGNACRMLGYGRDELIGTSVKNIDSEKDRARIPELIEKVKKEGTIAITMTHYRKDGTPVPVSVSGRAVTGGTGGLFYAFARDITDLKEKEAMLVDSLREKEVLLKEVHHRVKNNLQVISSIVYLKSFVMEGKDVDEILQDIQGRIKSISLIHEMLYRSENFASVEFDEYINILVREIYQGHAGRITVRFHIDLEEVALDLERAIPCALVIYELVLNAVKHAFPGMDEGRVSITGSRGVETGFRIEVADNGVGLPENVDLDDTGTLGLELVHTLIEQLDGSVCIERGEGTKFVISFN